MKILFWLTAITISFIIAYFVSIEMGLDRNQIFGYVIVGWAILSIIFDLKKFIKWLIKKKNSGGD